MAVTKIDFKRELRGLYLPGRAPELVEVPPMMFLMVDGSGDPNTSAAYHEAIEALYTISYTVKFAVKDGDTAVDFGVMPLEGLWWGDPPAALAGDKSQWCWTAMIMQPEPVTAAVVDDARRRAAAKRSLPALERLRFERFDEGPSAQMLYLGPYAEEGPAIAALHAFIHEHGRVPAGRHHEIYLGDPRRCAPEKLRTVIRQPVAPPARDVTSTP